MSVFNNISQDFFNNINNFASNPFVLIVLVFIILVYYILFAFLGGGSNSSESSAPSGGFVFIEALLWGIFILLIFINGISYFYGVNIITDFKDIFSEEPEIVISQTVDYIDTSNVTLDNNEVYHVPGNTFTYHDAKAVCNAFDGEIASYQQIDNAQKKGANWCSYGWSKDQLGLYPTSQNHWDKLQSKEGHEYDCGLPGVNGGKVSNPHTKLGANCFGLKPKKSLLESQYLDNQELYPKTQKELLFDERVKYWKERVGNVLLMPFNNTNWFKEQQVQALNLKRIEDAKKQQIETEQLERSKKDEIGIARADAEIAKANADAAKKRANILDPNSNNFELF